MSDTSQGSDWWQGPDGKWYGPPPSSAEEEPQVASSKEEVVDDVPAVEAQHEPRCTNGHVMGASAAFCTACGSTRKADELLCENGHAMGSADVYCTKCGSKRSGPLADQVPSPREANPMPGPVVVNAGGAKYIEFSSPLGQGAPEIGEPRPLFPRSSWFRIGLAVVGVIVVIVGWVTISNYILTHSISYKDGYSTGYQVESSDSASNSASDDCTSASGLAPSSDNLDQWLKGCEAGWNRADFVASHPGA